MARLEVGQYVVYDWNDHPRSIGQVTEVTEDWAIVKFQPSDICMGHGSWEDEQRWFTPEGLKPRYTSGRGPRHITSAMGTATPITQEIKTMTYATGQRVLYTLNNGSEAGGVITDITPDFIVVKLDDSSSFRNLHMPRVFKLDGTGTGAYPDSLPEGCKGTDWGTQLTIDAPDIDLWTPTAGREYPAEPRIIYGVFDSRGVPVQEYHSGSTLTGYGFSWVPPGLRGFVKQEADHLDLVSSLSTFMTRHKSHMKATDFDIEAAANPLDFLVGLTITSSNLYSDGWYMAFQVPTDIQRKRRHYEMTLDYNIILNAIGMATRDEVNAKLNRRPTIAAVDGDKITLDDGFEFVITARCSDGQPKLAPALEAKAILMDNLVYQRSLRDSTPNTAVNDDQVAAIAA